MGEGTIEDEALGWVIRVADPDFDDWDVYPAWLEADPAHAARYDQIALALAEAQAELKFRSAPVRSADRPAPRETGRPRPWVRYGVAPIAAALAAAVVIGLLLRPPATYLVATPPAIQRTVALGDGTQATMAGGSVLRLRRGDARVAELVQGEALFQVRPNPEWPFQVSAGAVRVTDIGTVFDVDRTVASTQVAVAEGAVQVALGSQTLQVGPGQAAVARGTQLVRRPAEEDVGGWRDGRLAFDNATLDEVAEALSRQLGRPISASPNVAAQRRRVTLDMDGLAGDPALLGRLLDVDVRVEGARWVLEARR